MQKVRQNHNLICLSGEVDFHQPCYTTDGKFEINHHGDSKYSLRPLSENINNHFVKKFKELDIKTDDLTIDELNDLLSIIYEKD